MHTHKYIHTHAHTHTHSLTYTHTHTHTHTQTHTHAQTLTQSFCDFFEKPPNQMHEQLRQCWSAKFNIIKFMVFNENIRSKKTSRKLRDIN